MLPLPLSLRIFDSIDKISAENWQKITRADFPFGQHAFLLALEKSDCLGQRTGWFPQYLTVWDGDQLVGALPLYLKNNSYGEYIFDFAWAQAFESVGLNYYPKLTSAIPFTSATGSKLMFSEDLSAEGQLNVCRRLLMAAQELESQKSASSTHALFIREEEIPKFQSENFFIRHSFQYHWLNDGYKNFEDFQNRLRSKRKREMLRERDQALSSGLKISRLTGHDLTERHAQAMYLFYRSTVESKGGYLYLTPQFFQRIFFSMKDQILFVFAEDEDSNPVAGALNFFGPQTLYGRNWGCLKEHKSLHLELCYYQGIEFAIERSIRLFEAGAQGEHKFQRGFLPRLTYSAHHLQEPRLASAIKDFVEHEKRQIAGLFEEYRQQTPYSRAGLK